MTNYKPRRSKSEIEEALVDAKSLKDVLINLNLRCAGGNYSAVNKWIEYYDLEKPVYESTGHPGIGRQETPLELIFCENSSYSNRSKIKKKLVDIYDWEYKCHDPDCPNPEPLWKGRPLVIQLEHKNGVHNDNRLENLEFLCPNCHTQTDTYAGKGSKTKVRISKVSGKTLSNYQKYNECPVEDCTKIKNYQSKYCADHGHAIRYGNEWPNNEDLLKMVELHGNVGTAKIIGTVSEAAVRKRVKQIKNNAL